MIFTFKKYKKQRIFPLKNFIFRCFSLFSLFFFEAVFQNLNNNNTIEQKLKCCCCCSICASLPFFLMTIMIRFFHLKNGQIFLLLSLKSLNAFDDDDEIFICSVECNTWWKIFEKYQQNPESKENREKNVFLHRLFSLRFSLFLSPLKWPFFWMNLMTIENQNPNWITMFFLSVYFQLSGFLSNKRIFFNKKNPSIHPYTHQPASKHP